MHIIMQYHYYPYIFKDPLCVMHYNYDIHCSFIDSQAQALDVAERLARHSQDLHHDVYEEHSSSPPLQARVLGVVERFAHHGQDLHHDIDEEYLPPLQAQAPTGVIERITVRRDQYSESPCSSISEGQPLNELHVSDDVHVYQCSFSQSSWHGQAAAIIPACIALMY